MDFLDDEDEVAFGAFDGEERDLELINALGMDIGDLDEAFGERLNIVPDEDTDSEPGQIEAEDLLLGGRLAEELGGAHLQEAMLFIDDRGHRVVPPVVWQTLAKTIPEIFMEMRDVVLAESPTLRLAVAIETGNIDQVKEELEKGDANLCVRTPQNVLRRRIKLLSTTQSYSYENISEISEQRVDNQDQICLLLIHKCPELIDFDSIFLMINRDQNALFKYTIEYIENHDYYQRCFQRSRQETLDTIFKETYIEKAITIGTVDTIPIFKRLKYNINTGFQLLIAEVGDMSMTVLDKFLQNLVFKLERTGYGWADNFFIDVFQRDKLVDKTLGRLEHGYSVILANLCDYGFEVNKKLNRLDMCDYGALDKTLLTYLIISLVNLNESNDRKTNKKIKMACSVFSECLAVLINKRISSVMALNNALLSFLVSLDLPRVHWSKRQTIIIELTQRRHQAKIAEDQEWAFQQSLLDSKGRRAFSARGRGRKINSKL